MTIANPSGSSITSVKTLVWGFKKGDIAHYPRPSYSGTALTVWQTDQVRRWSDGSVKVAIISFPISLNGSESRVIDFVDDTNAASAGSGLTESGMLAFMSANWNIESKLTYNGVSTSVDARTLLNDDITAGKNCGDAGSRCTYWLKGPVVTEMILQGPLDDQTHFFDYTLGFDQGHGGNNKPVRPRFEIRAYPSWTMGVREVVTILGDMSTRLEALSFDYDVLNGSSLANSVYSKHGAGCTSLTTCGMILYPTTTFRKVAWDGTAPPAVDTTDYNMPYKVTTGLFPHWDPSLAGNISSVSTSYWSSQWNSSDHCLHSTSHGNITQVFTGTGGRWDIGPTTQAHVLALFAPGAMRSIALGESECSMNIPFHMIDTRTGSALYCSFSCTGPNASAPAFARFPSPEARPTFMSGKYGAAWDLTTGVQAADKVTPIYFSPTGSVNGWTLDGSHHPDLWYASYFLSDGDYYYYSELVAFALYVRLADTAGTLGYQHHGIWAISHYYGSYQTRGYAWTHRTAGNALTVLDPNDPAYQFLSKHLEYDARVLEGAYEITAGNYPPADSTCTGWSASSTAVADMWCWGKLYVGRFQNNAPPAAPLWSNANGIPFAMPRRAANKPALYPIDFSIVVAIMPPWMSHYAQLIQAWNERREITQDSAARAAEAQGEMRILMSPGLNRWLAAEAEWPTTLDNGNGAGDESRPGQYIDTAAEWKGAWLEGHEASGSGTCDSAGPFHFDALTYWRCTGYYAYSSSTHTLEAYAHSFRATAAGWVGLSTTAFDGTTSISGQQVWDWVNGPDAQLSTAKWNEDPRYAIIPDTSSPPPGGPTPPAAPVLVSASPN